MAKLAHNALTLVGMFTGNSSTVVSLVDALNSVLSLFHEPSSRFRFAALTYVTKIRATMTTLVSETTKSQSAERGPVSAHRRICRRHRGRKTDELDVTFNRLRAG